MFTGECRVSVPWSCLVCYGDKRNTLYISIHLARLTKNEKIYVRNSRRGTVPSVHIKVAGDWGVTPRYLIITNIAKENTESNFYLEDVIRIFFSGLVYIFFSLISNQSTRYSMS
jgi:hypothetical protein